MQAHVRSRDDLLTIEPMPPYPGLELDYLSSIGMRALGIRSKILERGA